MTRREEDKFEEQSRQNVREEERTGRKNRAVSKNVREDERAGTKNRAVRKSAREGEKQSHSLGFLYVKP